MARSYTPIDRFIIGIDSALRMATGQTDEAFQTCIDGLAAFPDDLELQELLDDLVLGFQMLEPYLEALSANYETASATIEEKILEVAKIGASIIPLLLEKLEPRRESPRSRNLAANCALALGKFEPASFVDSLIEIAQGENYTGIGLAITLLGRSGSERAGVALTQLLDTLDANQSRKAVRALTRLEHKGAVLKIAKGLPYPPRDDEVAVRYLRSIGANEVVPHVLRALKEVKRIPDLMRYIQLLGACAHNDAETAHALLPYFDHEKLDDVYWSEIAQILAVVAPKGDKPTIERLKEIVKKKEPGTLELRAALTLRILGDKVGPEILRKSLRRLTSSSKTGKDYLNWSNLAEFYLEFGDYRKAVASYRSAIDRAHNPSIRSQLYIDMARAQARRTPPRPRDVRDALRDSLANLEGLMEAARIDPILAKAMQDPIVKKFIDSFPK